MNEIYIDDLLIGQVGNVVGGTIVATGVTENVTPEQSVEVVAGIFDLAKTASEKAKDIFDVEE